MTTHRRSALSILALAATLLAVTACGGGGGLGPVPTAPPTAAPSVDPGPPDMTPGPSPTTPASPFPTSAPTGSPVVTPGPTTDPTSAPIKTMVVRAYYVLAGEVGVEGLVPTLGDVPESAGTARAAMDVLLRGDILSDYRSLSSAIPAGTRLLGLTIRNGVATVDLSREFESGGGSASAFYRLGQVVYTLTQFSTVNAVLFQVDGRTVTTFGSEGIVLDGPQTRADFEDLLPAVFVDRPAFGAAAGNPLRLTGNANVFEATFMITIMDGSGRTLVEQHAMATCGTGCRGTFDVTLRYDVPRAQWGTLRVWVSSARDGLPENVRDYPVWLTPAG
ncbi:MAG: GerMN domain-containing protein [Chloroflexota bacterium]